MLTATRQASPAILHMRSTRAVDRRSVADDVRDMGIEAVRAALVARRNLSSVQRQEKQMADARSRAASNAARLAAR